ncbi:MAG: septal ring lytic transglycosylase RlpA family protein [Deinococcales bacterium]|nr:septal ring lytic transglycosylase RlpA family protein [Chitinophagaceae bacterium]
MKILFILLLSIFSSVTIYCQINDSLLLVKPIPYKIITGKASFYSANLHGTKTATGEKYDNLKLTAASNNFKLNTWVLVTNLSNEKTVVVRINDRMHPRMAKKGRVLDLSGAAAKKLDFIIKGITKVEVEPIDKPFN